MARGIDTASHRGALRVKGQTLAVLGSGLANIYPSENKKLFEEIAHNGVVMSEFPMTTAPLSYNFPRRNRIISGLSLGVVIVEAGKNSGALITSRFALEQGREVFAVPGKVDNPNTKGVHHLIQEGAKLIGDVDDILVELEAHLKDFRKEGSDIAHEEDESGKDFLMKNLSEEERNLYGHIHDDAVHIDDIAVNSGFSLPQTMTILLRLELKHLIKQLPGKRFVRSGVREYV
jgi:DNA processing protein